MAIIAICFSSFIGLLGAAYHFMVLGASFPQSVVTYFVVSAISVAFFALSAWAGSMIPRRSQRRDQDASDELEDWQDWMMEEEAELDALFDKASKLPADEFVAPKRKSA